MEEIIRCSICNNKIIADDYQTENGFDAWPFAGGRCCYMCYMTMVMPENEYNDIMKGGD